MSNARWGDSREHDILAFAERILPRASDLWVQASLDCKQRLQQLFFPEGIAFDGNRFDRTAATALLFNYLARPAGLEPAAPRLEVSCSIHLSYGRVWTFC